MTRKKHSSIVIMAIAVSLLLTARGSGTINSVTLTPANPTLLSSGLGYYLAGLTYNFDVNVIDPDITGWAQLTDVRITIPNSTNILLVINPSGTGTDLPVTVSSGNVNAVADITGTYNNCTVTFKVTFRWDTPESAYTASRNVTASATSSNTVTNTRQVPYGVCSTLRVFNFSQDGVAADGMINPWHSAFSVSGIVVYNVPGASGTDTPVTVDPGEITGAELYLDGAPTGFTDTIPGGSNEYSMAVAAAYITAMGTHTWAMQVTVATPGGPVTSTNQLAINCDQVEITAIQFINGGGVDSPSYYRSVNAPGTQVRITARMRNSLGPMVGNTTITIRNTTEGADFPVQINNGQTTGVANVPNPTVPASDTEQNVYRIQTISGGAYDNEQNDFTRINQPASPVIYWDNDDPPGANTAPFTAWGGLSQTAFSLTFNWTALNAALPDYDGDFYTYRVYYRESGATDWTIVDRTTTGYASLGTISTNSVTIQPLRSLTTYEYYITAIDVFGQDVAPANSLYDPLPGPGYGSASTLASSIVVSISDGITTYDDNSFTINPAASARPLRKANTRVSMFIIAEGGLPDVVNLIVAQDGAGSLVTGGVITSSLVEGTDYYRISSIKKGPNEWVAYIPETLPIMAAASNVRFIIEANKGGVLSYSDHNSETEPAPGDPNDYEWTFTIGIATAFTPWPTRILNNVITDKNPVAYPAYYLSDDAYVTIQVFDIKGRPLVTLTDNEYRRGGQNIKENGWRGDNKARNKLGMGLYYIHIEAKRVSDGKTILNSFQKVVIAK